MTKRSPLFTLFITIFIDLLGFGIVIPILPIYAKELGAGEFMIGVIAASFSLMQFVFGPVWGSMSDRYGRRPIILGSIAATGGAYLLMGFATTIPLLIIARIIAGIGSANISAAQAYIADISTPEDRAKKMGLIGAAFGLGFIFGPPAGGYLKAHFGMEGVGFAVAGLCLANFILAWFTLAESLKVKSTAPAKFNPLKDLAMSNSNPVLRNLFMISFIFITAFSMMQIFSSVLWSKKYEFNEKEIGWIFTFIGVVTAVIQGGLIGVLSRKFGERQLIFAGNCLMAIGLFSLPFVPPHIFIPVELLGLACIALANGCLSPTLTSMLTQYSPEGQQGKILGLNQSLSSLGRVVGPLLGGLLGKIELFWPFVGGAALMGLSGMIASRLFRKRIGQV